MPEEEKRFDEWMKLKSRLHNMERIRNIHEGGVVVCYGRKWGMEINGKNEVFSRPVLVLRKFSRFGFMGIPLTSQIHDGAWYCKFEFQDKIQVAVLAQARNLGVSRLYKKTGQLSKVDLELVRSVF